MIGNEYYPAIKTEKPIAEYFSEERNRVFAMLDSGDEGAEEAVSDYLEVLVEETNRQLEMLVDRIRRDRHGATAEERWMVEYSTIPMLAFWLEDAVRANTVGIKPPLLDEIQLKDLDTIAYFDMGYVNPKPVIRVLHELKES